MIVLDTNVVSEFLRPTPAEQVEQWLAAQDGASIYFTAVGEAELRHGLAILPAGKRRNTLSQAIEGILEEDFRGRILPLIVMPPALTLSLPPRAALPAVPLASLIARLRQLLMPMKLLSLRETRTTSRDAGLI